RAPFSSSTIRRTTTVRSNSASARTRAARPSARRRSGSPTRARTASVKAARSPWRTRSPVPPSTTAVGVPPARIATIGRPLDIASSTLVGRPSARRLGSRNTSAAAKTGGRSSWARAPIAAELARDRVTHGEDPLRALEERPPSEPNGRLPARRAREVDQAPPAPDVVPVPSEQARPPAVDDRVGRRTADVDEPVGSDAHTQHRVDAQAPEVVARPAAALPPPRPRVVARGRPRQVVELCAVRRLARPAIGMGGRQEVHGVPLARQLDSQVPTVLLHSPETVSPDPARDEAEDYAGPPGAASRSTRSRLSPSRSTRTRFRPARSHAPIRGPGPSRAPGAGSATFSASTIPLPSSTQSLHRRAGPKRAFHRASARCTCSARPSSRTTQPGTVSRGSASGSAPSRPTSWPGPSTSTSS